MITDEIRQDLWDAMNLLLSVIKQEELKHYFLSLLVLKYLNDNKDHPFNLPESAKWNKLRLEGMDLGKKLDSVFHDVDKANPILHGVFTLFPFTTFTVKREDYTLVRVMAIIDRLSLTRKQQQVEQSGKDNISLLIESIMQLLGRFGEEFISPPEIPILLTQLIKPINGNVYDGTMGIGQDLIESFYYSKKEGGNIQLYGQEIIPETLALAKINFILHGIYNFNFTLSNVITNPLLNGNGSLKIFDYVLMEPPFGIGNWGRKAAEEDLYGRFRYGIPSTSSGDMAFLQHSVASLNEKGKGAVIVPPGVLFRGGPDERIRKGLLKEDLIEAVITLPSNLYTGTGISVAIILFNKDKHPEMKRKVHIIQAENDFLKRRGKNILREQDIGKIVNTYETKNEIKQYSVLVSLEELENNEWSLEPKHYFENAEVESKIGLVEVNRKQYEESCMNTVLLGDVAEVFRGLNVPTPKDLDVPSTYTHKLINLADVQDGKVLFDSLTPIELDGKKARNYEVQPGDVILSSRGVGFKAAVIPDTEERLAISSNFIGIRPIKGVDGEYIKAFLESPIGLYYINLHQKGTVINMLSHKDIEKIKILMLPLEQQRELANGFIEANTDLENEIEAAKRRYKERYTNLYQQMGILDVLHFRCTTFKTLNYRI